MLNIEKEKSDQFPDVHSNGSELLAHVFNHLKSEWISECRDLCIILQNPNIRAALYAADCIARRDFYPVFYSDIKSEFPTCMSDDDDLDEAFKIVHIVKNEEPLGATVTIDDKSEKVIVARVIYGGAAQRSGLINVGDEVYEVNGIKVNGKSLDDVIHILERECQNSVITFKLIPTESDLHIKRKTHESKQIVRAHFDYNPVNDPYHPCVEIGISFNRGNILHIVNDDDPNWWQTRKEINGIANKSLVFYSRTGLIPGKQLQERRFAAMRDLKSQYDAKRFIEIIPGIKSPFMKKQWIPRKVKKIMYDVTESVEFDREEIATYESVARYFPRSSIFRPIVFIGPDGVGRKELIKQIISHKPQHYKQPIAHTSRAPWEWEIEGYDYLFVDRDFMEKEIKYGNFIEYGEYKNDLYGIHRDTLINIIDSGYVCLLNPYPQTLKLIYNSDFKPYIIFVKPPYQLQRLMETRNRTNKRLISESKSRDMIFNAHKLNYLYGHYFDTTIVNEHLNDTVLSLIKILNSVENEPQWVPSNWVLTCR